MNDEKKKEEEPVDFSQEKDVLGMDKPESIESESKAPPEDEEIPEKPEPIDLYKDIEFPSLVTRIQGAFVDVIVLLVIFYSTAELISIAGGAPDWLRGGVLFSSLYLYEPFLISSFGGTLGHLAMGLRVKSTRDPEKKLFILNALVRILFKVLLGWLSFLTVTRNKRRRAIHDIFSGSVVMYKKS